MNAGAEFTETHSTVPEGGARVVQIKDNWGEVIAVIYIGENETHTAVTVGQKENFTLNTYILKDQSCILNKAE